MQRCASTIRAMAAALHRAALVATGALALAATAAGCGGGGGSPSTADVTLTSQEPDQSTVRRASRIKAHLAAAGYVVQDLVLPRPTIRGPLDQQALAHGPQKTFVTMDADQDRSFKELHARPASIICR